MSYTHLSLDEREIIEELLHEKLGEIPPQFHANCSAIVRPGATRIIGHRLNMWNVEKNVVR